MSICNVISVIIITLSYCRTLNHVCKIFPDIPCSITVWKTYARFFPASLALLQFERRMQDFSRHPLLWFPAEKTAIFSSSVSLFHALLWNHKTLFNFYLHFIFELQDYIIEKQVAHNFSTICFERCIEVSTNRSVTTKDFDRFWRIRLCLEVKNSFPTEFRNYLVNLSSFP